jgi:hypothetical protein
VLLRSILWIVTSVVSLAVVAGAAALCVVPSRFVAVAAGLVTGGVAGNLVSAARHGGRVPNVLTLGRVAFTPADLALVAGAVLLTAALARAAIVHRAFIDRHVPPRRWERGLRRRLGL